jgi:hypothetical protein
MVGQDLRSPHVFNRKTARFATCTYFTTPPIRPNDIDQAARHP